VVARAATRVGEGDVTRRFLGPPGLVVLTVHLVGRLQVDVGVVQILKERTAHSGLPS
jgi:hypothetical protein